MHGVISQFAPEYPVGQAQVQVAGGPGFKTFTPLFKHVKRSHGPISQSVPLKPSGHVHTYELPLSAQVPPLTQGFEEHGVTSQNVPEYSVGHVQTKLLPLSAQAPPFRHGVLLHGVVSQ